MKSKPSGWLNKKFDEADDALLSKYQSLMNSFTASIVKRMTIDHGNLAQTDNGTFVHYLDLVVTALVTRVGHVVFFKNDARPEKFDDSSPSYPWDEVPLDLSEITERQRQIIESYRDEAIIQVTVATMNFFKKELQTVRPNAVELIHEAIRIFVVEFISITIQAIDGPLEQLDR